MKKWRNAVTRFYVKTQLTFSVPGPSTENKQKYGRNNKEKKSTRGSTGKIAKTRGSKFKKWNEKLKRSYRYHKTNY